MVFAFRIPEPLAVGRRPRERREISLIAAFEIRSDVLQKKH